MKPSELLQTIHFLDKYSRFDYETNRRETWEETVLRSVNFLIEKVPSDLKESTFHLLYENIINQKVSPSMRLMATAGKGAELNNASIYNCSFLPLETIQDFHDLTLLLGLGVGVGFSIEKKVVDKLPKINRKSGVTLDHIIDDNIYAWAESISFLLTQKFYGHNVHFDYSKIRPAGTPLKTRGGRASGPKCLMEAHIEIGKILDRRSGDKLKTIDVFDIACYIAGAIVSGGVRRSAMIALFDNDDEEMLHAKSGDWRENLQRQYANISAIVDRQLTNEETDYLIDRMHNSGFGEPGIFSRYAVKNMLPIRRRYVEGMGTNPCGEIVLRPRQFCNLSQAIIRADDTEKELLEKVRVAAIIGTIQSSFDYFPSIHPDFKKNTEEERLLGVSLSGICDNKILDDPEFLAKLNHMVIQTNREWAFNLRINFSAATTCVKPDGNTSVLYNTSPGLHPRYSKYYIRRIRLQFQNPIAKWLMTKGIPCEPVNGETWENVKTVVFDFPIQSPQNIDKFQLNTTAKEQLERWENLKYYWTEHNPSVTIHYQPKELQDIKNFIFECQYFIGGLSFLENGHQYIQAPYEEIDETTYKQMIDSFPNIELDSFWQFETSFDSTSTNENYACTGGACTI